MSDVSPLPKGSDEVLDLADRLSGLVSDVEGALNTLGNTSLVSRVSDLEEKTRRLDEDLASDRASAASSDRLSTLSHRMLWFVVILLLVREFML